MSEIDLVKLKALAEVATQGEWSVVPVLTDTGSRPFVGIKSKAGFIPICETYNGSQDHERRDKNAAFIAAANPQTILSLIALLTASQEREKALREALKPFAEEAKQWHADAGADDGMSIRVSPGSGEDVGSFGTAKFNVGDLRRAASLTQENKS